MSSTNKKSMILYHDFLDRYRCLSDEETGQLVKAMLLFSRDGIETEFDDRTLQMAFDMEKSSIINNNEKYEKKVRLNSENGKKGGRPRKTSEDEYESERFSEKPKKSERFFEKPKKADNDNVSDNVNDNVSGSGIDNDNVLSVTEPPQQPFAYNSLLPESISGIINAWNQLEVTQNINLIKDRTKRFQDMLTCIDGNLYQFLNTISSLDDQAYFQKRAKTGNKLSFDWFVDPNNYQKVIEGNYREAFKTPEELEWEAWENA